MTLPFHIPRVAGVGPLREPFRPQLLATRLAAYRQTGTLLVRLDTGGFKRQANRPYCELGIRSGETR